MMSQLEAGFMRHITRGKNEILWSSKWRSLISRRNLAAESLNSSQLHLLLFLCSDLFGCVLAREDATVITAGGDVQQWISLKDPMEADFSSVVPSVDLFVFWTPQRAEQRGAAPGAALFAAVSYFPFCLQWQPENVRTSGNESQQEWICNIWVCSGTNSYFIRHSQLSCTLCSLHHVGNARITLEIIAWLSRATFCRQHKTEPQRPMSSVLDELEVGHWCQRCPLLLQHRRCTIACVRHCPLCRGAWKAAGPQKMLQSRTGAELVISTVEWHQKLNAGTPIHSSIQLWEHSVPWDLHHQTSPCCDSAVTAKFHVC